MNAADKAWATRRKNTRTKAAKKAWRTMRKRYTKEEIHDRAVKAAKKAWKTIRANAA